MRAGLARRARWLLAAPALLLAVAIAYEGVRRNGFVYDDLFHIVENSAVRGGLDAGSLAWALTTFTGGNWHPLTWISLLADIRLFGLDPAALHAVNVVLHCAAALALLLVLAALTGSFWRSAAVSALFALHPLHVEAVAWVAERKEILGALFGFLAVGAYARYVRSRRPLWYALVCLAHAASLAAKPMLVTLPLLLLLLDWWPLGRLRPGREGPGRAALRLAAEKAPLALLAAGSSIVTVVAQSSAGAVSSLEAVSLPLRLANAATVPLLYLAKAAWPAALAVFYPFPAGGRPAALVAASAALLALAGLAAWRTRRRLPHLLWGLLFFLVTLVPVIGLVQVGAQAMADRYTYVPLTGPFLAVAFGIGGWCGRSRRRSAAATAVAVAALLLCVAGTRRQVALWRDGESLFLHAARVTERNWIAHAYLGKLYLDAGRLPEAQGQLEQALAIQPRLAVARNNLGIALERLGLPGRAEAQYRQALRDSPAYALAHNNLGRSLARRGAYEEALASYREALRLQPRLSIAHNNLAAALTALGRREEAARHIRLGLERRP